jgi:hypothetical protein
MLLQSRLLLLLARVSPLDSLLPHTYVCRSMHPNRGGRCISSRFMMVCSGQKLSGRILERSVDCAVSVVLLGQHVVSASCFDVDCSVYALLVKCRTHFADTSASPSAVASLQRTCLC